MSASAAASGASSASAAASSPASGTSHGDAIYQYDEDAINKIRRERPWEANVKNFTNCKISALAAMKMLKHALAGVEKGRKAGTNPIEVMGLMIGKPEGDSIIVMDCCPLPVEGSETRVVADDAQVYMTQLMDSMELRRKEGFVGWYHSHPFDVETYTHCHLSAIDVQTQTGWQMASGAWTSIVVDPLRSLAKQEPEIGVYRCYPPKYNPPANECPDGSINTDVPSRTTRWGLSYHRYYQLRASYFMSGLGNQMLEVMSKNALWVRVLGSSSIMEPDNRERFADRIKKAAERLQNVDATALASTSSAASAGAGGAVGPSMGMGMGMGPGGLMGPMGMLGMGASGSGSGAAGGRTGRRRRLGNDGGASDELTKGAQACCELATEQCKGHSSQLIKDLLFNYIKKQEIKMRNLDQQGQAAQAMQVDG